MSRKINKTLLATFALITIFVIILLVDVMKPGEEMTQPTQQEKSVSPESPVPSSPSPPGVTNIRWFVGLSTGTDPTQKEIEQQVVDIFNDSHESIQVELEFVPYSEARTNLATQIENGQAPDIIGPVGIGVSNAFHDQWLDLNPLIETNAYDLSMFDRSAINVIQVDESLLGLPISVFPAVLFYQKHMFDHVGLNHPPANIGDPYVWPDGSEEAWDWDTLAEVAKRLTLDSKGLNPLDQGFNSQNIVTIGFHPLWLGPTHIGTYFAPGKLWTASDGTYTAQIPATWISAWDWWHDGMFGEEPFIPNGALAFSPEFGIGNTFNARKTAMVLTQLWYTCCLADAGEEWDLAAFPSYQGTITGRLNVDTFRIWKGTPNPDAAFKVLTYLVSAQAVSHLCVGDEKHPGGAYDSLPALKTLQDEYLQTLAAKYPFVENWDIIYQSMMYPDIPSAESWMPNWQQAWTRVESFGLMLQNNGDLDLDSEIQILQSDLDSIFNK